MLEEYGVDKEGRYRNNPSGWDPYEDRRDSETPSENRRDEDHLEVL